MENIKERLKILPNLPGCYLMKDQFNEIIYVGKAKILKNRVTSYFVGSHNAKTTRLVEEIVDFDFIITNSELESLVLELNLIKKYDPKYNIKLKDDKTYPYIEITNEKYPRIRITRNTNRKDGKFFGPYPNVYAARETEGLLNKIFPFRKCDKLPKKECLYYHIHQCLGPCIHKLEANDYQSYIHKASKFLKGNNKEIVDFLHTKMLESSEILNFEKSIEYKALIENIITTTEKQKITMTNLIDCDIIGFFSNNEDVSINIFYMRQGKIVNIHKEVFSYADDYLEDIHLYLINLYFEKDQIKPKEIWTKNVDLELIESITKIKMISPMKGKKKELVDLAFENARIDLITKSEIIRNKNELIIGKLESLKEVLNLNKLNRIEIFDNSNILGTNAVSGMVVYVKGEKSFSDYRKYIIKDIEKPDDYLTTRQVIYRRYLRILMDDLEKPDLIIIDGGKGHLTQVLEVLQELNLQIPAIGLKKNEFHKTYSIVTEKEEIILNNKMSCTKLLSEMQEEVHRFAITFHKKVRSKGMFASLLDEIDGIGEKRKKIILKKFKTIDSIRNSSLEQFKEIGINEKLFTKIREHLK